MANVLFCRVHSLCRRTAASVLTLTTTIQSRIQKSAYLRVASTSVSARSGPARSGTDASAVSAPAQLAHRHASDARNAMTGSRSSTSTGGLCCGCYAAAGCRPTGTGESQDSWPSRRPAPWCSAPCPSSLSTTLHSTSPPPPPSLTPLRPSGRSLSDSFVPATFFRSWLSRLGRHVPRVMRNE